MLRSFVFAVGALLVISCQTIRHAEKTLPTSSQWDGLKCVIVTLNKMQVFYIGVDNPLFVLVSGISSSDIKVSIEPGTIEKMSALSYNVRVTKPGEVKMTVSYVGSDTDFPQVFHFRAKRIPDPVPILPTLNLEKSKEFTPAEFHQLGGLILLLENFDFEARCDPVSYMVTRMALNGSRQVTTNEHARFGEAAKTLIEQAQSGDIYIFSDIQGTCPGDEQNRRLSNVAYFIR